ncbi:hypothetical protein [Streptomyces sp. IBSBF 2507]|uniref:hypothetical protein n=1 Tax=Streptomyces sp. IBSBF 2507 TaxID=2903530 RepID=UPI00351F6450
MSSLTPNPHSPYADADPNYRHLLLAFFGDPCPGVLCPTACERLAVVPEEPLQDPHAGDGTLPNGLCPTCVAVTQGGDEPRHPVTDCRECEAVTDHDGLCALCRQEKHDEWWPTRANAAEEARP